MTRSAWCRRTTLRDGTAVLLRQIRPQDRDHLAAGQRELSPTSRYLRFHADVTELSSEQLTYLTEVDHVDHEAIVAVDLDRPGCQGIGVARYIRDHFQREVAEAMVTIADRYQGQGAATVLLGGLAVRGREQGIDVFRHHVLARNEAMLEVFDHLGATRELAAGGLWRVDLELPRRPADLPDSPAARGFMTAASERCRLAGFLRAIVRLVIRPVVHILAARPPTAHTGYLEAVEPAEHADELTRWLADRDERATRWPASTG